MRKKTWSYTIKAFTAFLLFPLLIGLKVHGQEASITNVSYQVQENNVIVVDYDLLGKDKKYVVQLVLKRQSRSVYSFMPETVIGDVGKGKYAGIKRKIIWSMDHETGEGFVLDPFADDYYFVVQARRKYSSAWLWITLAAGGAIWYVSENVTD